MAYLLRQSKSFTGAVPTISPWLNDITLDQGLSGAAGARVFVIQAFYGPGHGKNQALVNGTLCSVDIGNDDVANTFSVDISFYDEVAGDAGATSVQSGTTQAEATTYSAVWVGEYIDIDQSAYGFAGHNYDASFNWSGTGQSITLSRSGSGNNCNYSPELSLWAIGGHTPPGLSSESYFNQGYITDSAQVWLAVQDYYFNATGVFDATWGLGASTTYDATNFTFKTTSFPLASGLLVAQRTLMGLGL